MRIGDVDKIRIRRFWGVWVWEVLAFLLGYGIFMIVVVFGLCGYYESYEGHKVGESGVIVEEDF